MMKQAASEYNAEGRELREQGTAAFPVACYSGNWQEASVQLHWHKELEAGVVTAGQVTMYVGKEKILLQKGEGFLINTGIPHAFLKSETGQSCQRSVVFDPILVGGRFDSIFWQNYVQPVLSAASVPWFRFSVGDWQGDAVAAVEKAWDSCNAGGTGYELEVRYALSRLLALTAAHLPAENPAKARHIARDNERIRIMLGYIQAHFSQELTTGQIAQSAMISVSEALRCFHNTIGLTPMQYTRYYRIQRAAKALQETDQKIVEIGAECGFQEMSYFAKAFREQMGVTPRVYRERCRKQEPLAP